MADDPKVLLVSAADVHGGAERCAYTLFEGLQRRGVESWLAVGDKSGRAANVLVIPNEEHRSGWARFWRNLGRGGQYSETGYNFGFYAKRFAQAIGEPDRFIARWRGHEDFDFPGTEHLLNLTPTRPRVVHLHNLHSPGGYFDLRFLTQLSQRVPVIVSLHDLWLGTGHCAYPPACGRWQTGCGQCPDLTVYPSVLRDETARNWRVKQHVYANSKFYVATASRWMLRQVEKSMLRPAVIGSRVIPTGVNRREFHPANRRQARERLGIPTEAMVLMYAGANGIWRNPYKDFRTIHAALKNIEGGSGPPLMLLVVGESAPAEMVGSVNVRYFSFETEPAAMASYYQAVDVFVHAAKSDTFPNTVLEALACGTPVVATAVGGVPEQVNSLGMPWSSGLLVPDDITTCEFYGAERATGILVPPGNPEAMAAALNLLIHDSELRRRLSCNAASDAEARFDIEEEVTAYLDWYRTIIYESERMPACSSHRSL